MRMEASNLEEKRNVFSAVVPGFLMPPVGRMTFTFDSNCKCSASEPEGTWQSSQCQSSKDTFQPKTN